LTLNKIKSDSFSALNRAAHLEQLEGETFDLLVIGGGVTGCGIALDAAARGMKTALVEKEDFASGTSSKSTKLIHGGLRYLKQLEFGLVRETGTERAIVHRLAPHLVLPEKMLLPIIEGGTFGKWTASIGVMVYDILAGVTSEDRRVMLSKEDTFDKEPLLNETVLKGGCLYAEYRTDDARLTVELIKTAAKYGAAALNYCLAKDFIYENDKVKGAVCVDELTGRSLNVKAKQVVSAGGPWVDELRQINHSLKGKRLHLTKGVHIVFPHEKLPLQPVVYFDVSDGRMVFAIPRGKITYVGTSDTDYHSHLDRVIATKQDAQYLVDAVTGAFPSIHLGISDIISNWAGLRPLIHEGGKSASELSRKDEIFESPTGLISIAGGKLTGYRKMAQRIVDLVDKRLEHDFLACTTAQISLASLPFKDSKEVNEYIQVLATRMLILGLEPYHAWYLTTTYGKEAAMIVEKMENFTDTPEIALIRAEAWYGVHHEMVNGLEDFFVRRTGRLYFDIDCIAVTRDVVVGDLTRYLNWSAERVEKEQENLEELLFDATHYHEKEIDKK